MGNNTPDYEDNLYFEPQPTWEDVVKVAQKYGYEEVSINNGYTYLVNSTIDGFVIYSDGTIYDDEVEECYTLNPRTYTQLIKFFEVVYE